MRVISVKNNGDHKEVVLEERLLWWREINTYRKYKQGSSIFLYEAPDNFTPLGLSSYLSIIPFFSLSETHNED